MLSERPSAKGGRFTASLAGTRQDLARSRTQERGLASPIIQRPNTQGGLFTKLSADANLGKSTIRAMKVLNLGLHRCRTWSTQSVFGHKTIRLIG